MLGGWLCSVTDNPSQNVLAIALNPRVTGMVQEELESVFGGDRLPGLPNQEDLPHVSATIKELFWWGFPVPLEKGDAGRHLWWLSRSGRSDHRREPAARPDECPNRACNGI